jgi:hypothetical protein
MQNSTDSTKSNKWYVECGASLPEGKFTRNHIMPASDVNRFRFKFDNRGVYATAYLYDSTNQTEANIIGDFYLDFDYDLTGDDQEQAFDVIRKDVVQSCRYLKVLMGIQTDHIRFFFSGSKGVHLIIPKEVMGVKPTKNLNVYYRMLAEDINKYTSKKTMDLKIYDNRRLFRMPNSIHTKTGLYKIPITYEELTEKPFSYIQDLARRPRIQYEVKKTLSDKAYMEIMNYEKKFKIKVDKTSSKGSYKDLELKYMPPCVENLLENEVGKGQRNDTVAFLASYLMQAGKTQEETLDMLLDWNNDKCNPSMPEREVGITVNSIYNGGAQMGCSTAKIISVCNLEKCRINKGRK